MARVPSRRRRWVFAPILVWRNLRTLLFGLGQMRSFLSWRCQNGAGMPIPWFTYAAIEYLENLDLSGKSVFEFGAGTSTMFWSRLGANVVAVEFDEAWVQHLRSLRLPGATILHGSGMESYVGALKRAGQRFDIIVIDGRYRDRCADEAIAHLAERGMIVLDNADWLPVSCGKLRDADLIQVDFSDFGPICPWRWTTSFFLRRDFAIERVSASGAIALTGGIPKPSDSIGL